MHLFNDLEGGVHWMESHFSKATRRPFAIIGFWNHQLAQNALSEFHGSFLFGRKLRVKPNKFEPLEEKQDHEDWQSSLSTVADENDTSFVEEMCSAEERLPTPQEAFLARSKALRAELPFHWYHDDLAIEKVGLFIMETFLTVPGVDEEETRDFASWCIRSAETFTLMEMMASFEGFVE